MATSLLLLVFVALAGDLVERWRLTSRQPEPRGPVGEAAFWAANVACRDRHRRLARLARARAVGGRSRVWRVRNPVQHPAGSHRSPGPRGRDAAHQCRHLLVCRRPVTPCDDAMASASAGAGSPRRAGGDLRDRANRDVVGDRHAARRSIMPSPLCRPLPPRSSRERSHGGCFRAFGTPRKPSGWSSVIWRW